MWHVLVFPITGSLKGFVFPDAIQALLKGMPEDERESAVRVSRDESEGYMLLEGDWSNKTIAGAEIHGPMETADAAKSWIEARAKRWVEGGGGSHQ